MSEIKLPVIIRPGYLAKLIKQGLTVMINGHYYRILKVNKDATERPCDCCNVDSNCKDYVLETCRCLDSDDEFQYGLWQII